MRYSHGITAIDTSFHRPMFDASYLIVERGRGAFVDVGTNYSVPILLAELEAQSVPYENVDWVILTHVHLDHAGGAGELLRHLPNARLVVHPRGARHMIDPGQLIAGATAVYGEAEIHRSYGVLIPVPAERIVVACDGHVVDFSDRPLLCLDTPGHARHHIAIWDAASAAFFPGDTFGLSYREFDTDRGAFILPTTTPVQFEPEPLRQSISRLLGFRPQQMFLTHFGRVIDVRRLANDLIEQIAAMVAVAQACRGAPDRHERIKTGLRSLYIQRALSHGCAMGSDAIAGLLEQDIELNAQGLSVWLDRTTAG